MAPCLVNSLPSSSFNMYFELHLGSEQKKMDGLRVEFFRSVPQDRQCMLKSVSQETPNAW